MTKRRVQLSDLSPEHQAQVRDQLASRTSNVESRNAYAGEGSNCMDPMATPVRIRIHSKRKRLGDAGEGYAAKPVIDGLVRSGLLPDDSPEYLPQPVDQTHEKSNPEETVVIVETL